MNWYDIFHWVTLVILWACVFLNWWTIGRNIKKCKELDRAIGIYRDMIEKCRSLLDNVEGEE